MRNLSRLRVPFLKFTLSLFCLYFNHANGQPSSSFPANQFTIPAGNHNIQFIWQGDSVNARWEPYAALLIPVKIANCLMQFYMQFDLGSPVTLFYSNKIKAIQAKYPGIIQLNDSATKLINTGFTVGDKKIAAKEINLKKFGSTTINWTDRKSIEIIGTIGVDFIENRVAIIDYPKRELLICNDVPENISSGLVLSDFMFVRSSILLTAIINKKKTMLYFDTGSSAYELLTNKETCTTLAGPNTIPVQYKVKSWDRILTANTVTTRDSMEIANQKIPIVNATYIEGASDSQVERMMKMGMGGMTGNKLFLNYILVLDTKNKKFGIIKPRNLKTKP